MKRGLVIGKFMPPHKGHLALIEWASRQCDELIVSLSWTANDPIDPSLRMEWLREIFDRQEQIIIAQVHDDFDQEHLPLIERTKIWADVIRKAYPPIDILFTSEAYGDPFAMHLGAHHRMFDPLRKLVPVSATQIRQKPLVYWNFLPKNVQPYFVVKVCFYGPESTGKSTMAHRIAALYETLFVPEVARELLTDNVFTLSDIERIGIAQQERVTVMQQDANRFLICDTDAITTEIYSDYYLNAIPPLLFELEKKEWYHIYFLFDVDVPWVEDGLRDLGHKRQEMFHRFRHELEVRRIPYVLVTGDWEQRERIIRHEMDKHLK